LFNFHPGSFGPYPGNLTALGNTLFFIAYDSVNGEGGDSRESVESS